MNGATCHQETQSSGAAAVRRPEPSAPNVVVLERKSYPEATLLAYLSRTLAPTNRRATFLIGMNRYSCVVPQEYMACTCSCACAQLALFRHATPMCYVRKPLMDHKGAPPGELSVWQKQEKRRQEDDAEARSVTLQPIQDHKAQRIKNKLSHCLNRVVRRLAVDSLCLALRLAHGLVFRQALAALFY